MKKGASLGQKSAYFLIAAVVISGCTTPEWRAENAACTHRMLNEIPPSYKEVIVNREKAIRIPDGNIRCTGEGKNLRCDQGTRTEYIPYTSLETVDMNGHRRSLEIEKCTANACFKAFGNPDCKS